jgi:hypothetical protein
MTTIAVLERQVAELRALVRERIGAPTQLLVIVRGDESVDAARERALARVPPAWRDQVRLDWLRLPWMKGRNVPSSSTPAVRNTQASDFMAVTPAVLGQRSDSAALSVGLKEPPQPMAEAGTQDVLPAALELSAQEIHEQPASAARESEHDLEAQLALEAAAEPPQADAPVPAAGDPHPGRAPGAPPRQWMEPPPFSLAFQKLTDRN